MLSNEPTHMATRRVPEIYIIYSKGISYHNMAPITKTWRDRVMVFGLSQTIGDA